ncbi:MAG: hypothetical protein ACOCRK_08700 [bacterium]
MNVFCYEKDIPEKAILVKANDYIVLIISERLEERKKEEYKKKLLEDEIKSSQLQ